MATTPTGIYATIAKLAGYQTQPWAVNAAAIDAIIVGDGYVYRWLRPTDVVAPEFRPDRINIHCNASQMILNYTVG